MKRLRYFGMLIFYTGFLGSAFSQTANQMPQGFSVAERPQLGITNSFYFDLGVAEPVGQDFSGLVFGFSGGMGVEFGISRTFSFALDAYYNNLPASPIYFANKPVDMFSLLANAKLKFDDKDNPAIPYAILGLGPSFYSLGSITWVKGFARLGLGVDIKLSKGTYFVMDTNLMASPYDQGIFTYAISHVGMKLNM